MYAPVLPSVFLRRHDPTNSPQRLCPQFPNKLSTSHGGDNGKAHSFNRLCSSVHSFYYRLFPTNPKPPQPAAAPPARLGRACAIRRARVPGTVGHSIRRGGIRSRTTRRVMPRRGSHRGGLGRSPQRSRSQNRAEKPRSPLRPPRRRHGDLARSVTAPGATAFSTTSSTVAGSSTGASASSAIPIRASAKPAPCRRRTG